MEIIGVKMIDSVKDVVFGWYYFLYIVCFVGVRVWVWVRGGCVFFCVGIIWSIVGGFGFFGGMLVWVLIFLIIVGLFLYWEYIVWRKILV